MTLNIRHHGIELTPAIHQYIEEKFQSLTKYLDSINHIDVEINRVNEYTFECKANLQIAGEVMQLDRSDDDLYKAIDKVRDHLRQELSDWKKKMEDRSTGKM